MSARAWLTTTTAADPGRSSSGASAAGGGADAESAEKIAGDGQAARQIRLTVDRQVQFFRLARLEGTRTRLRTATRRFGTARTPGRGDPAVVDPQPRSPQVLPLMLCMTKSRLDVSFACQFRTTSESGSATGSGRSRIESMKL